MCSRNPSVWRRSILRPGNISSALHSDHSSSAPLTATKPSCLAPVVHGSSDPIELRARTSLGLSQSARSEPPYTASATQSPVPLVGLRRSLVSNRSYMPAFLSERSRGVSSPLPGLRRFLANALQRPWLSIQTRRAAILYRWLVPLVIPAVSIESIKTKHWQLCVANNSMLVSPFPDSLSLYAPALHRDQSSHRAGRLARTRGVPARTDPARAADAESRVARAE